MPCPKARNRNTAANASDGPTSTERSSEGAKGRRQTPRRWSLDPLVSRSVSTRGPANSPDAYTGRTPDGGRTRMHSLRRKNQPTTGCSTATHFQRKEVCKNNCQNQLIGRTGRILFKTAMPPRILRRFRRPRVGDQGDGAPPPGPPTLFSVPKHSPLEKNRHTGLAQIRGTKASGRGKVTRRFHVRPVPWRTFRSGRPSRCRS